MRSLPKFLYSDVLLTAITTVISIGAFLYFYLHGELNLSDYDAIARLDTARKILDSITPGVGQLGAVWLPFPTVLMLPFIWNDFLWHSGIAGAVISEAAFIIGAVYLKKLAFLITKSIESSLLVWFIFITNINILYYQTTAMSESLFLFSIIMSMYYLTKWIIDQKISNYMFAAFFIIIGTLTRYEGYFVFIGSFVTVIIKLIMLNWKSKNLAKIEGMSLLFLSVAGYGVFLWCLYCLIFLKDPLYWLHVYSGSQGAVVTSTVPHRNLFDSLSTYSQITLWMSGILVCFLGSIGYLTSLISFIKDLRAKKNTNSYFSFIIVSTILFLLLIYGYQKGYIPSAQFEPITLQHVLSKSFNISFHDGMNIRYGLEMMPFIALFVGLFAAKAKKWFIFSLVIVAFQVYTTIYTSYLFIYSVPRASDYEELAISQWLKNHYTDGLILISAYTNETIMFQTGFSYNHFLYEGTMDYWNGAIKNPAHYAKWIVYQNQNLGDQVYALLASRKGIKGKYKLVYSDNQGYYIYELNSH